MKTSHNLNNDVHAHDCLFIHCEAYLLFHYYEIYSIFHHYEAYPLFHYYDTYPLFHYNVHALCFTIQTIYSYSLQIMLSLNTINQSTYNFLILLYII